MSDCSISWPILKSRFVSPCLEELAAVLQSGLLKSFEEVSVQVVDCPDLTKKPYLLAAEGICGSPRAMDIGGVPYLLPIPCMEKKYDLSHVPSWSELHRTSSLMIGAGAAPSHAVGKLAELIINMRSDDSGKITAHSHICKIDDESGKHVLQRLENSLDSCHLSNLFISEGKRGKVIEVCAKHRKIASDNFIITLQKSVQDHYGSQPICVGGVFVMTKGKALIHVMPGYSEEPLNTADNVDHWLKFIEMSSPLTCLGYFVSHDPGLCLRMEHFHCFSEHGDGGHFHYDVTPQDAEYIGYFNVADYMFRVDKYTDDSQPVVQH